MAFRGGVPGKNLIQGGKNARFWQGSPDKIHIPGAKYHVIGVNSTRGNSV